jgi:hypothetical protein
VKLVAALLLVASGCVTRVVDRCPSCAIVDAHHPYLPALKPSASALFILVPGDLGYGWEWDHAVAKLRASTVADFVVFEWSPFRPLEFVAQDFSTLCRRVFMQLPPRVHDVVIVAHSGAGILVAEALRDFMVPHDKAVTLVTIGTPFAGMGGAGFSVDDPLGSPAVIGIFGTFVHYPEPPPMLKVIEYVTTDPPDPVMKHRFGHDPAPVDLGPKGAERILFTNEMDHNVAVELVVDALLERVRQ